MGVGDLKERVRYSWGKFEEICRRLEAGETLVHEILAADDMPAHTTFLRWVDTDAKHEERYRQAMERQAQYWIDQAMYLSRAPVDDVPLPEVLAQSADEVAKVRFKKAAMTSEMQRRRLQIDSAKWFATKIASRLYGDKVKTELEGSLTVETTRFDEPGGDS